MAKKPTKSKTKPRSANQVKRTLKAGQLVEEAGIYRSEASKTRATLAKGDFAPPTPLKNERWHQVMKTPD